MEIIKPQAGAQEQFLATSADICLYGGSAGGGKTFAILLEPLRHIINKHFSAMIFRRTSPAITNPGGLYDEALNIYPNIGAKGYKSPNHYFVFPSGAKVVMSHLQYDDTVHSYQGSQIPLIIFDELTHFSWKQFMYMLSRNRSAKAGIKPYIRATCNPDPDSWVAEFISWWIDQETGLAIPERSGIIRWFVVIEDVVIWGDTKEELKEKYDVEPKSFTFIRSSIYDNKILLQNDAGYLANLQAQDQVTREQLLNGNWKIRPASGMYFKENQVQIVDVIPSDIVALCRGWDLAGTEETPQNKSPDKTAGVLMARLKSGQFIVLDVFAECLSASSVRQAIINKSAQDRVNYRVPSVIRIPQDPGQAGKEQAQSYVRMLSGYNIKVNTVNGSKITRAEPFASQWQQGNVMLLRGDWNKKYINEMVAFPEGLHDDVIDASSDAFNEIANYRDISGFLS